MCEFTFPTPDYCITGTISALQYEVITTIKEGWNKSSDGKGMILVVPFAWGLDNYKAYFWSYDPRPRQWSTTQVKEWYERRKTCCNAKFLRLDADQRCPCCGYLAQKLNPQMLEDLHRAEK